MGFGEESTGAADLARLPTGASFDAHELRDSRAHVPYLQLCFRFPREVVSGFGSSPVSNYCSVVRIVSSLCTEFINKPTVTNVKFVLCMNGHTE